MQIVSLKIALKSQKWQSLSFSSFYLVSAWMNKSIDLFQKETFPFETNLGRTQSPNLQNGKLP